MSRRSLALVFAVSLFSGCEPADETSGSGAEAETEAMAPEPEPEPAGYPRIVALGDSLTAGYGIHLDEAYPAALQNLLDAAGYRYEVVNAGVSGDTSAGGVRRLDWVLEGGDVAVLILALGANDGLRGLSPVEMKKNLAAIIEEAKSRGIIVLLAGLGEPDGQRDAYVRDFLAVYPELAREHDVALVPFFLDGVAGKSDLNQSDGKHPNAEGARILAENVFERLKPLLPPPAGAVSAP
jgi:acyl-CoA thioesterase-1